MTDSITEAATRRLPPPGRLVRLWPRVRPYRWHLVLASITLVLSGLLALAFPMAVRYMLDAAFVNHDRALLIAQRDDLEEQIRARLVNRQVPQLIE